MDDVERVIVMGASAGGIEALKQVLGGISADIPAALAIVVHLGPSSTSLLAEILGRTAKIEVRTARSGEPLRRGHAYVAPPDRHLLLRRRSLHLSLGPRENRQRPAIDPLFRSAARHFGAGAIGVVLSGNLDDGASGLLAIRNEGGLAVIQCAKDAFYPDMPRASLASVPSAHVVPAREMAALLENLVRAPLPAHPVERMALPLDEARIAEFDVAAARQIQIAGRPSTYVCPDCGGTLFAVTDSGDLEHYRCRVGHAYSIQSLYSEKEERLNEALWAALRALDEHADLSRRAATRARAQGLGHAAEQYEGTAVDDEERARIIRDVLTRERGGKPAASGSAEPIGKEP